MPSRTSRIDRFISRNVEGISQKDVRLILAQKRVMVDGKVLTEIAHVIDRFSHVTLDGDVLQNNTPVHIMLNKPKGVVSATKDVKHKTVVDLLQRDVIDGLHIVGRLDYNSTGLLLLTNDGRWSRELMHAEKKIEKVYRVILEKPLQEKYIHAFQEGMYFNFEGIKTLPAKLRILSEFEAEVTLIEGRYHQVKRMFGRFDNKVLELHRVSIGRIVLDPSLQYGQSRELVASEIKLS